MDRLGYCICANRALAFYQDLKLFGFAHWSFSLKKCQKGTLILKDFLQNLTKMPPTSVPWRPNQEWCSICVDTVVNTFRKLSRANMHYRWRK